MPKNNMHGSEIVRGEGWGVDNFIKVGRGVQIV